MEFITERQVFSRRCRNVHDYFAMDPDFLVTHMRDGTEDLWAFAQYMATQLQEWA
jgi:uncharacterized protein YutE (UPF0331/DUF86 family)